MPRRHACLQERDQCRGMLITGLRSGVVACAGAVETAPTARARPYRSVSSGFAHAGRDRWINRVDRSEADGGVPPLADCDDNRSAALRAASAYRRSSVPDLPGPVGTELRRKFLLW